MRLLLLLPVLAWSACGVSAGSPCTTPRALTCASGAELLSCEGGVWAGYACPACGGSTCTWTGAKSGDACPEAARDDGWCPLDGRALSCFWSASADAGVFIEKACSGCRAGQSLREVTCP